MGYRYYASYLALCMHVMYLMLMDMQRAEQCTMYIVHQIIEDSVEVPPPPPIPSLCMGQRPSL